MHAFSGGKTIFMKKGLLITVLVLVTASLWALPSQVSISLTTKVPAFLVHGFLIKEIEGESEVAQIMGETSVGGAFNADGVSLTYAIETNVATPLVVSAVLTPFIRQDVSDPVQVGIESLFVDDQNKTPTSTERFTLLNFTPSSSGKDVYEYVLTVKANQAQVEAAPAGEYISTISIDIAPVN